MNPYARALALNLTGTDAEIVAKLNTVTASPISLAYLMELLNFRGMLRKTDGAGGQERWVGTLPNLKAVLVALNQAASVSAYEMWFSHVTNPRQVSWDTTIPDYSAPFAALKAAFADQEGMPTSADFAAVVALGGGKPYEALTVEEYALQKAAYEADQAAATAAAARAAKINQWRNRVTMAITEWSDGFVSQAVLELTAVAAEMEA